MGEDAVGLSGVEALRLASCVAVAMVLFMSAALSSYYERGIGRTPLFAWIMALLGWCTLTLGASLSGVSRLWPPVVALAPLLSGYLGPLIFAYTRQLIEPGQTLGRGWFCLGLMGTTYSVLALTTEDGLHWPLQVMVHSNAYWHPLFSPLMLAHSIQLVGLILLSTVLITKTYFSGAQPARRKSQFRLLMTCWTGMAVLVFTNILPSFRIVILQIEPALITLPFVIVGVLVVRALGQDLAALRASQDEARELRMESLGRLARGLAHDLNNVLTAIVGHAELARLQVGPGGQIQHHLGEVIQGSQRASSLLERMLIFSGRRTPPDHVISAQESIEAAFRSISSLQSPEQRIELEVEGALPWVRIEAAELESALLNLLENGLQALGDGPGRVCITARRERSIILPQGALGPLPKGSDALWVEVRDTGSGMSEEVSARALEPFFTSRSDGKGLGLVNVLSSVMGASGALWFETEEGRGTSFILCLPSCEPPVSSDRRSVSEFARGPCIVVEDDPEVAEVTAGLLESLGFEVAVYRSAEHILDELSQLSCLPLVLAVVDIRLGAIDGVELAERLLAQGAVSHILLLSADECGTRLERFAGSSVAFRRKPIARKDLELALATLLHEGDEQEERTPSG